jgi:hypothetical protein
MPYLAQTFPKILMWRLSRSNGITEGFHTKMVMNCRRAYGFGNLVAKSVAPENVIKLKKVVTQ